ncbi:MAG: family 10 glycosylhydrolase [Thermoguttaceae bacterium]
MRVSRIVVAILVATMLWTAGAMTANGAAKRPTRAKAAKPKTATAKSEQTPARVKPAYPDGEMRAVFCLLPKSDNREEGMREIEANLRQWRSGGINTLLLFVTSRYLAALDDPELQKTEPKAAWDAVGEMIRAAKKQKLQVHALYAPWLRKDKARAVELEQHPEWTAIDGKGKVAEKGVLCFVRPEVRQFELDQIAKIMDRYPDLVGIQLEEPGYRWRTNCCYCDTCRAFCQQNFGIDIQKNRVAAKPTVQNLAAFMCTDFVIRLRKMMLDKRPDMWLSANGGFDDSEWYLGRDWHTWARRGLIDFYMPQVYCDNVKLFTDRTSMTKTSLDGRCDLIPAIGLTWQAIAPKKQPPTLIKAEIEVTRNLGTKGFSIFPAKEMEEVHYQAVREAVNEKPDSATTP